MHKGQLRLVLIVSILASFVAFLDGSIVNVALPSIVRDLGGGLALQQWVVDGYLISLGALILIAGSLSDLFGRKRILEWGLIGFGITSLLCALAPTGFILVAVRILQGAAGALLVPSSLALIISAFPKEQEGKAIGRWNAWTSIAFILGPLLGGFLVDAYSWRFIFAINIVPIAVTLFMVRRLGAFAHAHGRASVDLIGAILCALGLGLSVYALIEEPRYGWTNPLIWLPLAVGVLGLAAFVWFERRTKEPMLPLALFKVRNFGVGNLATVAIYAGLSVASFLIIVFLQQVEGYSAIRAGLSLLPVTIIMFVMSPRFGALAGKYGPRFFMGAGPIVAAGGFLYMLRVGVPANYLTELLPGIVLFGFGLSMTVSPLTTAILGAIESRHAGIASAVNNAVARVAGLVAIATLGIVIGSTISLDGFHRGVAGMAMLLVLGGVISAIGIENAHTPANPTAH